MIRFLGIYLLLLLFVSCTTKEHYIKESGSVWNTQYSITYKSDKSLSDSIVKIFDNLDSSISPFNKKSLISQLNNNESVVIDSYFKKLYENSSIINQKSDGFFDPTISPLINYYGFGYEENNLNIDSISEFIGICKTHITNDTLYKEDNRITFNFSAIAKGMACDEIACMFTRNGINDYMIEIGGEIALNGFNPKNEKWKISIDTPIESNNEIIHNSFAIIELDMGGIATSGNYRNFRIEDGNKYTHINNPRNKKPDISYLLSVTKIAETSMLAA